MKILQALLKFVLPNKALNAIKADSQKWFFICPNCDYQIPYLDAGAIRYKAFNAKKRALGKCPQCRRWVMFRTIRME
jgi:hypothetical protein